MVLLTFGYMIPLGLERWGCRIPRPQKEAFLHLWKVVGHVMGIREDLMTHDWDEAKVLLDTVLARQAYPSDAAKDMTGALMDFLREYMPHLPGGLRQRLAAHPIIDQLGQLDARYAEMILPPEDYAAARKPLPRLVYGAITRVLRLYYRVRNRVVGTVPVVGDAPGIGLAPLLRGAHRELARPVPPPAFRGRRRLRLGAPPRSDSGDRAGAHALAQPRVQQPRVRHRPALRHGDRPGRGRGRDPRPHRLARRQVAAGQDPGRGLGDRRNRGVAVDDVADAKGARLPADELTEVV